MRLIAIGLLIGTLASLFFKPLPNISAFWLLAPILLIFPMWRYRFFIALIAGSLLFIIQSNEILQARLPSHLYNKDIIVYGKIASIPDKKTNGWKFILNVQKAHLKNNVSQIVPLKGRVQLNWYQHNIRPNPDEEWRLTVRLKPNSGFSNPGGFDYEKWLFSHRIIAKGYIRQTTTNQRIKAVPFYSINHLRLTISEKITQLVDNPNIAAIISALAVADRSNISTQQWNVLKNTGTHHLMAISGLHIGIVAGLGVIPTLLLSWLFPSIYQRIPFKILSGLLGAILAINYALLAGFTLPTQRALIMVLVVLGGIISRRSIDAFSLMSIALTLILLFNPLALLEQGFWLSFTAVGIIFYYLNRRLKASPYDLIKLQLAITLIMLPLGLFFYNEASITSPIANLIAIPWVSFIIVPSILISLLLMPFSNTLTNLTLEFSAWHLNELFLLLNHLSNAVPNLTFFPAPLFLLVISFLGMLMLWLPKGFPLRWLGLVILTPLISYRPSVSIEKGSFDFYVLDVGQGQATVVQTQNHVLIYDTGPKFSSSFNTGKKVVLPFLATKGIKTIDVIMLSHEDMDHRGGTQSIVNQLMVKKISSSDTTIAITKKHKRLPIQYCQKGQYWEWDGVSFEVLHPPANWNSNDNNRSCILKIATQHHALLLMGDAQKKAEKELLKQLDPKTLQSDVLFVGHHGSNTSSSDPLLDAVQPTTALISAGFMNRYKMPSYKVIQRLEKRQINYFNTADMGMIHAHFPNKKQPINYHFYRLTHQFFWNR